ncbi:ribosomal protein S18 acetylase RimI-like enzyme [Pseudomonas sp. Y3 TE3536]
MPATSRPIGCTSYGFNEIGRRRDYYPVAGGREDALVMACTLFEA